MRGLPVERWSADNAALAYHGLGLHIGEPMSQNANGDLLGHVRDEDLSGPDHSSVRLYRTRKRQDFHADGLVGHFVRNVRRWRDARMLVRRIAAGLHETRRSFRRIRATPISPPSRDVSMNVRQGST